ncbi:MAG: peptide-methionine (S)-S-oxide reductase MsrA [archaeon]|jgi:peptide-methionine (S)-S-oxide reductase|nr:peptide-methionine (S)-S-oxide reductase MsrA [archaeon]
MTTETATFGGGCFWHIQYMFSKLPGIIATTAGYEGGDEKKYPHPTYEQVSSHKTGYAEVVEVQFDNEKITYGELLDNFWKMHDPTTLNKQGADIGTNYRSVIFYHSPKQRKEAMISKEFHQKYFEKPIVTEVKPAKTFFKAEEYHQKYVLKTGVDVCPIK